jgi:hypothetical protein
VVDAQHQRKVAAARLPGTRTSAATASLDRRLSSDRRLIVDAAGYPSLRGF